MTVPRLSRAGIPTALLLALAALASLRCASAPAAPTGISTPPENTDRGAPPADAPESSEDTDLADVVTPGDATPPPAIEVADQLFDAGLYVAAEVVYREELALRRSERALLGRALCLLLMEAPLGDRSTATELLAELRERFPDSEHAGSAAALLAVTEETRATERELARVRRQLEALREIDLAEPPD